jgi:fatty acid desaturase
MSLMYLNNNLHHTHHADPALAWYRLPARHRLLCSDELAAQGAGLYRGYGELFRRYALRPFCQPVDPLGRADGSPEDGQ